MDITINRSIYRDKVLACWIGKNIGGTMGTPFEGKSQLLDIKGFTTPKGEPLPNDDLDLQLVWIRALKDVGPKGLNANVLSWYWRRYIPAIWNEYGVGSNNAAIGITPPMSGELYNRNWKTSNGAWIRSEVWACLAPGQPNVATKYAIMEASIDHGVSEGTAAEIFTAALESLAFAESNVRTLVEKALAFIPEDCKVAKYAKMVMEEYDKGTDWKLVREKVVEFNGDLGFFQAPGNLAYVILGLLYGEGDFLQSLLYAINCGDDTDCTGATVGAILGIAGGTKAIPADLQEYIGDRIITKSLDISSFNSLPADCTALTEQVMRLMPVLMSENGNYTEYTDDESAPCLSHWTDLCKGDTLRYLQGDPMRVEASKHWVDGQVVFEGEPRILPEGELSFEVRLKNRSYSVYQLSIRVMTPDGWSASYPKSQVLHHLTTAHDSNYVRRPMTRDYQNFSVTLKAGEHTEAVNRVYVAVEALGYPEPLVIPVTILG